MKTTQLMKILIRESKSTLLIVLGILSARMGIKGFLVSSHFAEEIGGIRISFPDIQDLNRIERDRRRVHRGQPGRAGSPVPAQPAAGAAYRAGDVLMGYIASGISGKEIRKPPSSAGLRDTG